MANISIAEIRKKLSAFSKAHEADCDERQHEQQFWRDFYACFGISNSSAIMFQAKVIKVGGVRGYIDSFIPGVLLVEQKSLGKNLKDAYSQAFDYYHAISNEFEKPKFIITCDFKTFNLYDLEKNPREPLVCDISELSERANWFMFLVDKEVHAVSEEMPVNKKAAEQIAKLHDALLNANYKGKDLESFLTRLLFCLFADDSGIFGDDGQFRRLVEKSKEDGSDLGSAITLLFQVLNTPKQNRQTNLDETLKAFEYVNGGLFEEQIQTPYFDFNLRTILLNCVRLDWSGISPAIFGAMFQAVLEDGANDKAHRKESRRELGAHYTSERNILKLIEPLFLNDLQKEFISAKGSKAKLKALYDKLPTLKFLDPACGCGNFLVIAYRELRRIENDVVSELFFKNKENELQDVSIICRVNVGQFYGIEIDGAAVHIARVAMYITDHQLNLESARRFGVTRPTVPLVVTPHIHHANALRINWNDVVSSDECSFILGNPPFIGHHLQTEEQKKDLTDVYGLDAKSSGVMDFVSAWYLVAARYIKDTKIKFAFVSTNSITQGEQVGIMWRAIQKIGIFHIHFAHQTFRWSNEAKGKAAVYCVIICIGRDRPSNPQIYQYEDINGNPHAITANQINAYLVDATWILLENRSKNPFNAPEMMYGSKPTDGGHYLLSDDEKKELVEQEPKAEKFIKPFIGAHEYLHNEKRWVIWLVDATPAEINDLPKIKEKVEQVRNFRKASKAASTRNYPYPTLFRQITQPKTTYVLIPAHTSENREYIPFGFFDKETIVGNSCFSLPEADLYHFGVIQSHMHMAWVRYTCGRLESRYRYSKDIVYNNFIWPLLNQDDSNIAKKNSIEKLAKQVLDARSESKGTLAELYDSVLMPPALIKAHKALDKAVDDAYGYKGEDDDASRVAFLFKKYEELTSILPSTSAKRKRIKKNDAQNNLI